MRRLAAALCAAILALVGAVVTAAPAAALGKVKCDLALNGTEKSNTADKTVVRALIDPIVRHNQTGAPHVHDFFGAAWVRTTGNPTWPVHVGNAANYADLNATISSCRIPQDTAGYWTPTLRYTSGPKAGQGVPVQQFTAYYRGFAGQTTHAGSEALPADVRLIAQDMTGYGLSGWTCGQNSTVTGGQNSIPDCSGEDGTPGNTLTAHLNFPSCWNGVAPGHTSGEVGDTRDNADFVYPTNKTSCPASHPREVVQLRETVQYAYTGDGTDVALDGQPATEDGTTYHGDFWNTWHQPTFEAFVKKCVNGTSSTYTGSCDP